MRTLLNAEVIHRIVMTIHKLDVAITVANNHI